MNKAHGKTLIIENNSNNSMINSLINNGSGSEEHFNQPHQPYNEANGHLNGLDGEEGANINLTETYFASKVVDRVVCDICNKQVCNKYFLRTHKQKVHGIYESNNPGNANGITSNTYNSRIGQQNGDYDYSEENNAGYDNGEPLDDYDEDEMMQAWVRTLYYRNPNKGLLIKSCSRHNSNREKNFVFFLLVKK